MTGNFSRELEAHFSHTTSDEPTEFPSGVVQQDMGRVQAALRGNCGLACDGVAKFDDIVQYSESKRPRVSYGHSIKLTCRVGEQACFLASASAEQMRDKLFTAQPEL